MTTSVVQKTIYGLVAIGAILLLAIGAMGALSYRFGQASYWTAHTHQVIEELIYSLSALQDVETGGRGYVVTGNRAFLEPFNWGKVAVFKHLDEVEKLTSDNETEQKNLADARKLAQDKNQFETQVVEAPNSKGRDVVTAGSGKVIMDAYRKKIASMIALEANLLAIRNSDLQQLQTALWGVTAFSALLAIWLLAWIFRITRTAIEDEKRRVTELNSLNTGLQTEIDQRKRTEKALKDTTLKLTSSNTDLQQFAYVASHDLQEPLRAVAGFLTLIARKEEGKFDEETVGWINHAVEGSQRMRTLINDLLAYARVESRGKDLVETDCNKALVQAKKDLSVILEETGAQINASELPKVLGEEGQLTQLFQNLIGNALKFRGSEKPVVSIGAAQKNGEWIFSVKDNGIGFDQEHAERIFVIFQRLQGREEYKGTGIGLALCKKIVERHGGRIWAESAKGSGSTFFFTIPMMQGET
jgi:signal transduction histidine kinase